jgi:predicted TIM-barrel fold metal-dependent hydrolase
VLALADEPDNPLQGVVACARPEHKHFRRYIEKIVGNSKLKGIFLHTQPDELGQGATFRQNVRDLCQYGLSFETLDASPWVPEVSNHQRILDALRMGNPHLAEQTVVHITGLFLKAALAVWASR